MIQNQKQGEKTENQNGDNGSHVLENKYNGWDRTLTSSGRQKNNTSSIDMVSKRWQRRTWKTQEVLERHSAEDLQNIEMTWTDYGEIADDRALWKSWHPMCSQNT